MERIAHKLRSGGFLTDWGGAANWGVALCLSVPANLWIWPNLWREDSELPGMFLSFGEMWSFILFVIPIHVFQAANEVPTAWGLLSSRSLPWYLLFSTEKLPGGLELLLCVSLLPRGIPSKCSLRGLWPSGPKVLNGWSQHRWAEKAVAVCLRKYLD